MQQLLARKLLAHCDFAAQVKSDQMKDCLAKINANRVYSMGRLLRTLLISHLLAGERRRTIPEVRKIFLVTMTFADYVARRDPVFERADAGGNGTRVSLCKL